MLFESSVEGIIEYVDVAKKHFQNMENIELNIAWVTSIDELAQILKKLNPLDFETGYNRLYSSCYQIESCEGYALIISQNTKILIKYKDLYFHPRLFDCSTQGDYVMFTNEIEYLYFKFEGICNNCHDYDNFISDSAVTDSVIVLHK